MLNVDNLSSGYRQVPVIQNVSFSVEAGETIALIGLNGAGKSTLLKTLLGLLPVQQGSVTLNGITIQENHSAYAQQIAYIPETPILYEALTLREHLEMTALGYGIPVEEVLERAMPLLQQFRLENYLTWFPSHFSKGMQQKVMIVCALVTRPKLLIVDEPFLGLDALAMKQLTELLRNLAQQGTAIILTTHVLHLAEQLCSRFLLLQSGKLLAEGTPNVIKATLGLPETMPFDDVYAHLAQAGGAQ
ncbi:MAG: ABC transporter ATP-binding protein [Aerococcaceae bacterium]|nr:ABC transporter ATP-binding protein [Aerococcaceae bacterium]